MTPPTLRQILDMMLSTRALRRLVQHSEYKNIRMVTYGMWLERTRKAPR